MYTVMHFSPRKDSFPADGLRRIGVKLNKIRPGSFDGLGNRHNAFGVSITDSHMWWDHLAAMAAFLKQCGRLIKNVEKEGIHTQFSVAVWRKDYEAHSALGMPISIELVRAMARYGVTIAFRIYYMGDRPKDASTPREPLSLARGRELGKARRAIEEGGAFAHWLHRGGGPITIPRRTTKKRASATPKKRGSSGNSGMN
jgi:hypothetical protein